MGDYGKLTADQATPSPPPPHLLQIHDFTITFRVTFCQVISPVKWKKKKKRRPEVEILFCSNRQENVLLKS